MTGDRERTRDDRREPEVPDPLRARVEALFVSYRGYEPKSFQEALSGVCDLAADRVGEERGPSALDSRRPDRPGPVEPDDRGERDRDQGRDRSEESLPTLDDSMDDVEPFLETGNTDAVVQELAAEVLDEMTEDVFDELEHGVDQGTGEGVADGMGARAAGQRPSPGDAEGVPNSLSADPESDCALCGRSFRVSVLETTILADDGSVALICPDCEG